MLYTLCEAFLNFYLKFLYIYIIYSPLFFFLVFQYIHYRSVHILTIIKLVCCIRVKIDYDIHNTSCSRLFSHFFSPISTYNSYVFTVFRHYFAKYIEMKRITIEIKLFCLFYYYLKWSWFSVYTLCQAILTFCFTFIYVIIICFDCFLALFCNICRKEMSKYW